MSEFKAGQRVRVIDGGDNPVKDGDTGTVVMVIHAGVPEADYLVMVDWDNGTSCGLFNYRLEKIEEDTLSVGDRVRILPTPDGTGDIKVPESWVGKEGEVISIITNSSFPVQVMTDYGYPQGFKFSEVEKIVKDTDTPRVARERGLKEGDRVRITAHITGQGEVGTLKYNGPSAYYHYRVEGVGGLDFVAVHKHEVEKVEVPEGDNDTEDEQGEPTYPYGTRLRVSGREQFGIPNGTVVTVVPGHGEPLYTTLPYKEGKVYEWEYGATLCLTDTNAVFEEVEDEQETTLPMLDVVNHPPHYKFSNGAEVIDITENLTSNGGQAVQYIARSTRLDGNNKGDVLEDLRKARWFIDREIERVEGKDA